MRSYYEGALHNYLQHHQPPSPYDTVEKVLTSDCKIITNSGVYSNVKQRFKNIRCISKVIIYLPNGIASNNEFSLFLFRYVNSDLPSLDVMRYFYDSDIDGVVLWSDNFVGLFNSINSPHRRLSTTKDRLFTITNVIYFRKKSVLINVINEKFRRLSEAGLIQFWISRYMGERKINVKKEVQSKLHIENVFGALRICAVSMHLMSFIVFILEMINWIHPRIKYALVCLTY